MAANINVQCPYCGKSFSFSKSVIDAPKREFDRINCYHCKSRIALDIAVRRVGKSTMLKKREKARAEHAEKELEERYGSTADALVKPWSSLTKSERINAAWKLGHRG